MSGKNVESISSAKRVKTRKEIGTVLNPQITADDCGCVKDQGCCQNKGCCKEGHCPAEMPGSLGCAGDNFMVNIKDHDDLIRDYIIENKESVVKYLKEKGVDLNQ